eukprot:c14021_g1_i2 orf=660-2018(+)
MRKDKSTRSPAPRDMRHHPYKPHGKGSEAGNPKECAERKEWEDALCPICLEFPHNAVLLICASHERGCRPYMCNTSYRHSNCLDQYQKAQISLKKLEGSRQSIGDGGQHSSQVVLEASSTSEQSGLIIGETNSLINHRASRRPVTVYNHASEPVGIGSAADDALSMRITSMDSVFSTRRSRRHASASAIHSTGIRAFNHGIDSGGAMQGLEDATGGGGWGHGTASPHPGPAGAEASPSKKEDVKDLLCPLCRGKVSGWQVIDAARKHLNGKSRSCSQETCVFAGTYEELRAHARCEHPSARPSEVDPARQRDWRRMERQRDMGDVLSSIRSAMPGAAVFGDYVIEDDIEIESEDIDFLGDEGQWWRVFFLLQIFGPAASVARERNISSRIRGNQQRQRRAGTARLRQWVENLHRGSNEADSSVTGGNSTGEQALEAPRRRQRNQRRHWGDVS